MTPLRVRLSRVALVGPLLVFSACGGGDDDASTTASGETTENATATATTAAGSDDATAVPGTGAAVSTSVAATTTEPLGVLTTLPAESTTVPTDPDPADPTTSAPAAVPGTDWEDPEGVFGIEFPSAPTEQNLSAELDDGTVVPVTAYLAEVGGAAAIVSCVATSSSDVVDVDGSLLESQSQALAQFGAEVTDSTEIELQGRPGLEYRGAIGEAGSVLGRTYVDGPRVCNLLVVGEPPIVDDVAPPFLDSFEFLQEAA